jgi:hypothetical protein
MGARVTWELLKEKKEDRQRKLKGKTQRQSGPELLFYEGPSGCLVPGLGQGADM